LPVNGSYSESATFTLPNVPAGNYYLLAVANDQSALFESNYANNVSAALGITIGTADLIATNFSTGATAIAGMNLPVSFTVMNLGTNAYSSYWYDGVTLSTNATLAGAIANWDWYGYHSLSPGGSYIESQSIPLPGIAAGNYYLIAQADNRNFVPESNKTNDLQALQMTITNRPPSISLLAPTNTVQETSCIPAAFILSAGIQPGSYAVTNVEFYDGSALIGHRASIPYLLKGPPFGHGDHFITAQAVDMFGLRATSQVATASVVWPSQLHVLRADLLGNDCVICMAALSGSNYLVQTATNLRSPIAWQPLVTVTNLVNGSILVVTNQRTAPVLFYRAELLP
jgi:hypothetical protein